jgi:predicted Zn-ribbon and HTH transcriptional regulator
MDTRTGQIVERRELCCRECGYGVVVVAAPAWCPMCRGGAWWVIDGKRRRRQYDSRVRS